MPELKVAEHRPDLGPEGCTGVRAFGQLGKIPLDKQEGDNLFFSDSCQRLDPRQETGRFPGRAVLYQPYQVAAEEIHQDRLGLVIEVMTGGDRGPSNPPGSFCEGFSSKDSTDRAGPLSTPLLLQEGVKIRSEEIRE